MKKLVSVSLLIVLIVIACKTNRSNPQDIFINLDAKSGSNVAGTVVFSESSGKVNFKANISGLKPGIHAIHIHEKSDCSAADGSSAGGHWNPTFKNHGKWGSTAYHKGDIGNFVADAAGKGTITMSTDEWCIGCGDPARDVLGKSIVVHEGADDFVSQPSGNAGARMACSAIIK